MKILVLGNGFDIDHNLPTSYIDFLNFCNYILEMDDPNSSTVNELKPAQLKYAETLKTCTPIKETFVAYLKNNCLLNYFNARKKAQGENWIDFEREIKSVVSEFKSIELELKESNNSSCHIDRNRKVYKILQQLGFN